jgi:hypothetical protein
MHQLSASMLQHIYRPEVSSNLCTRDAILLQMLERLDPLNSGLSGQ